MRLVKFAVDCEFLARKEHIDKLKKENNRSRKEVEDVDLEEVMAWKRRDFSNQTRCICTFFSRLLNKYDTEDTRKLTVLCEESIKGKEIVTVEGLGLCDVKVLFDYVAFTTLNDLEKKKLILETLMEGIRKVADSKKWDIEPFEKVYEQIIEANYVSEWVWKKPKQSPDRKHKAKLFLQHELDEITMSIIVTDNKGNELKRETIITEQPDEWEYSGHLGELKWLDNETVALFHKYNNEMLTVSIGHVDV